MTDTKNIETEVETTETQTDAATQQSDTKVLVTPLIRYAAIGVVLVGIIVTTALMLDRQIDDIETEIAALETEIVEANNTITATTAVVAETVETVQVVETTPVIETIPVVEVATEVETATVVETATDKTPVEVAEKIAVETVAPVEVAVSPVQAQPVQPAIMASDRMPFETSFEDMIAERNEYLKEMDRIYLEEFKASQQQQLEMMREQLARQEQRIIDMEKRQQQRYNIRAANIKETQQMREEFLTGRI